MCGGGWEPVDDKYGQRVVEILVPKLVDAGFTIVSGFMYEVDMEALDGY